MKELIRQLIFVQKTDYTIDVYSVTDEKRKPEVKYHIPTIDKGIYNNDIHNRIIDRYTHKKGNHIPFGYIEVVVIKLDAEDKWDVHCELVPCNITSDDTDKIYWTIITYREKYYTKKYGHMLDWEVSR